MTSKPGGYSVGELIWLVAAGERDGFTNVMAFQIVKARESGKSVLFFDFESSPNFDKYDHQTPLEQT